MWEEMVEGCFSEERGKVWKDCMEGIMSDEDGWDLGVEGDAVKDTVDCVRRDDVVKALKTGKASEPSNV